MKRIVSLILILCFLTGPAFSQDSPTEPSKYSVKGMFNKVKDKYFSWVPSWHEIAFIVNLVSIYQKTRDMYYNFTYQVRLIQSTVRLVERQITWFERTRGMIEELSKGGYTLYDIEQTFRQVAYLTGPNYKYFCYLTGRIIQNSNSFCSAFSAYSNGNNPVSLEMAWSTNAALTGDPNVRAFDLINKEWDRRPYIYESNLTAITKTDELLYVANTNLEALAKEKAAVTSAVSDENDLTTLNNSIMVQQICMINLNRAKCKLMTIDNLMMRNRVFANQILTRRYVTGRNEVDSKYFEASQYTAFDRTPK